MTCPCCGQSQARIVLRRSDVPVLQNRVWPDACTARSAPTGELRIAWCEGCDHLWNAAFDADRVVYDADYDNRQDTSPAFQHYLIERVDALADHVPPGGQIIEIGCGQGDFLHHLCEAADATGVGFDPAFRGDPTRDQARFVDQVFTPRPDSADLIVSRHVIEHLAEPHRLLAGLPQALGPHGRVVFECPDVAWILRDVVLWDFFYEHVHYFSRRSLRTLFERAGLRVEAHQSVFKRQYQWIVARADGPLTRADEPRLGPHVRDLPHIAAAWAREGQARLQALASDGGVALWGAGAKGVTYAQWMDPDARRLAGIVDLNPNKQGGHVAGTGHRVLSPWELPRRRVRHVIVMNPAYEAEIRNLVATEALGVRVHLAEPPRSSSCSPSSRFASRPATAQPSSSAA